MEQPLRFHSWPCVPDPLRNLDDLPQGCSSAGLTSTNVPHDNCPWEQPTPTFISFLFYDMAVTPGWRKYGEISPLNY
jgi:hypothetical protein